MDAHIQSLREELELSHTHQQQLQSKLCLARKQLMSIVDSKHIPESHSTLESVLALLMCDLGESTREGVCMSVCVFVCVCVCVCVCVVCVVSMHACTLVICISGITPHYNQATPEKRLSRAMETIELLRRELESCKV